ncbi:MAG: KpsF/GutQ family sugar-phosphate isomerase [Gemmatimonadetes bacterium]|nr:KpsF/GutQ family sugar-phosphate isomerase [Gemmatimonadota bacterium]
MEQRGSSQRRFCEAGGSGKTWWNATVRSEVSVGERELAPRRTDPPPESESGPDVIAVGRRVLELEGQAVLALAARLGEAFGKAVRLLEGSKGRVVVSGIGKSGIVARKIAATLTSTGSPALFLHPVEGLHGDLGIVGTEDVAILVSKSGETEELYPLLSYLARAGVPVIALTRPGSGLARHASVVLDCDVPAEACPMDLAPTASTTAALAMGDALAMAVLEGKGFHAEDFARLHPGGSLGRRLTVRVDDVMVGEDYPAIAEDRAMRDCIVPLAEQRGTLPVVDPANRVIGVVTTGDLTRLMEKTTDFLNVPLAEVMTRDPKTARLGDLGSSAARVMQEHGVMALPVTDPDGRIQGVVHLHDLMKVGVL